ncbi:hypothetical protein TSUD_256310 [Trifolium subterraneum]|uniref:Transmembrane protein n=1 Tax=Trifolium subterraneum TaxID=3900 RepID=A0A2Z6ME70_TRISU|nr:hypothetical protein TSUD_256310 [Trifolium subterraneum]
MDILVVRVLWGSFNGFEEDDEDEEVVVLWSSERKGKDMYTTFAMFVFSVFFCSLDFGYGVLWV